jgi:hypothetical protein
MKPSVGSFPDPTTGQEVATKTFADEAYAGLHASRGDYLYATMSEDDTQATPSTIPFDIITSSRGEITIASNEFNLKAGRTYQLLASVQVDHGAPSSVNFNWYDSTAAAVIGKESEALTTTATGINRSTQPVVGYIFTPTVDTLVHVRRVGGTANVTVESTKSWVMITEVGANIISASGDFIHAEVSVSHTPTQNTPIDIDTVISSRGTLSVDSAGRFSGLRAGRTYKLTAWVRSITTNVGSEWYDVTAASTFGKGGFSSPAPTTTSSQPVTVAIITPTVDTEVELWATNATPGQVNNSFTSAIIEELGAMPATSSYPPGHLDGLGMSYNTVSTVDIAEGTCKDITGTADINVTGTLTADITAAGANGLDTGSEASSTWYALYVIDSPNDVPAALLSTSFTSPTLPGTYTVFRRVGAVYNDSGSNLLEFSQHGNGRDREIRYEGTHFFLNAGNATTFTVVAVTFIPPTCTTFDILIDFNPALSGNDLRIRRNGDSAQAPFYAPSGTGGFDFGPFKAVTDDSQQIDYQVTAAGDAAYLAVQAYTDKL